MIGTIPSTTSAKTIPVNLKDPPSREQTPPRVAPLESIKFPQISLPKIANLIDQHLAQGTFSAAACLASRDKHIFQRAVYGNRQTPPPPRPLNFKTFFDLASLSKPLGAGLAILLLTSQGRLDLEKTIYELAESSPLPENSVFSFTAFRKEHFKKITVEMLLDHTSGLIASSNYDEQIQKQEKDLPPEQRRFGKRAAKELMKELVANTPPEAPPGEKLIYSDLNFLILGWLVEFLVEDTLDHYLQQAIYEPLGLADSLFFNDQEKNGPPPPERRNLFVATEDSQERNELIQGEVHDPRAWALGGIAGHAGLFATADSVWYLASCLLDSYLAATSVSPGANTPPPFFAPATVKRFWTHSSRPASGTTRRRFAWDNPSADTFPAGQHFSENTVGHLGFTGTSLWIDLQQKIIAVVLTNTVHPSKKGKLETLRAFRKDIHDLIAEAALAEPTP